MKTSVLSPLGIGAVMLFTVLLMVPSTEADDDVEDCGGCAHRWHSRDDKCVRAYIDNTKTRDEAQAECEKSDAFLINFDDEGDLYHAIGCLMEKAPGPIAAPEWRMVHTGHKVTRDAAFNVNGCTRSDGEPCDISSPVFQWCAANEFFDGSPQEPLQGAANADFKCVVLVINDKTCGCMATVSCTEVTFKQYTLGYIAQYRRKDKPRKPSSNMICSKPGFKKFKGKCYKCYPELVTSYNAAKAKVQADGANLTSCHSKDEFRFLSGLLAKCQPKPKKSPTEVAVFYIGVSFKRDATSGKVTRCDNDDQSAMDFNDAAKQGFCRGDDFFSDGSTYNNYQGGPGEKEPKSGADNTCAFAAKNDKLAHRLAAGPATGVPGGCIGKMDAECPAGQTPDCDYVCKPTPP